MARKFFAFIFFISAMAMFVNAQVTISGIINDYKGNPVDSCYVCIYNPDFSTAYETYSDSLGLYKIENVTPGNYACIAAMRLDEYPREQGVAPEKMKLEFWAWNVIANENIELNIRYDKMELYGTKAFFEFGGRQELLIYTRPMSVTKVINDPNYMDKSSQEKNWKVTVEPEYMDFEVFADGQKLQLISVQPLSLPNTNGNTLNDDCYLIQTSLPTDIYNHNTPYEIRVVGHNTQYDEWGESVYYLLPPKYSWNK